MEAVRADCHAHVYGGPEYPFSPRALFIPPMCQRGTGRQFRAVLHAHGLTHGLVVQAQPYWRDNSAMLDAIAASGGRLKGIGLIDPTTQYAELLRLREAGVVGFRVNVKTFGLSELQEDGAERFFDIAQELGWFMQIHMAGDSLLPAMPILRRIKLPLLLDHFGRPELAAGLQQSGFQALLELGREGRGVVKLSGPFHCSREGYPFHDVDPYIEAAIEAFTLENCIWGSDWPFVPREDRVDYGPMHATLLRWLPEPADRETVLGRNPARLFGFGQERAGGDIVDPLPAQA